jgi:hypothetical protein
LLWVGHRNLRDAASYVRSRDEEFMQLANRTVTVPAED